MTDKTYSTIMTICLILITISLIVAIFCGIMAVIYPCPSPKAQSYIIII